MSAFGDAAAVDPALNHILMSTGDLGASLTMAAAGYESVADMLMAELNAMGLNTSTTAMVGWRGAGGVMMQMSAAEFMTVCAAASAWVRIGQIQAAEVATAHTMAVESMIPAEACLTNRATQLGLIHTNFFGQNTPGIVGLESQYMEFWVQNATARTGYGSVVSTALGALAAPPPLSPTAANPAGAAAAVAQDAATQGASTAFQAGAKSMSQVAEGGMSSMQDIVSRMRELAVQASNGSFTSTDRGYMNTEYSQLKQELVRIQGSAKFNGKALLQTTASSIVFQVGLNNTASDQLTVTFGGFALTSLVASTNTLAGTTASSALAALSVIDGAMTNISTQRAKYGAAMNRLGVVTSSIQTMRLNITAANSRIRDVDVAEETSMLARNQVLSQAGVSVLSQANQLPQMAMNLLGR